MLEQFENMHPNKTWAYIDGLLCGVVLAWIFGILKKAYS